MATYLDLTRTSNQSCAFAFTVKKRHVDPSYAKPPGFYEYQSDVDFTVGGHYGCSARFQVIYTATGSSTIPVITPWSWQTKVRVTVNNGHGATNTQDVLIDSGSYPPGVQNFIDKTASISGTFSFTCPTAIYYDITESQPDASTYTHPPYTVYNQYERSVVGGTAVCSGTVNAITTTATSTIATPVGTSYQFTFNGTNNCSGSLSGVCDLLVSACLTNSIAIPGYAYIQYSSVNLFVSQTSTIQLMNTGTDDAFGDPAFTQCALNSAVALKRNMHLMGKINAFDVSYPDTLQVKITGFDTTSRTISVTGSYDEYHTINHYSFASTITALGITTPQSTSANNIPAKFKTEILPAGLVAAGDDDKATRLAFRGWIFNGLTMSLANETQILAGGTSNNRSYSPTELFNGYRYLDLEVKSLTGATETSLVTLVGQPNSDNKQWYIDTNSTSYVYKRIDLLSPTNKTSTVDAQDDPYPRLNPTNPSDYPAQEVQNSDYYGITRVSNLTVGNSNMQLNRVYLRANSDTVKSTFVPTFNYGLSNFRKYQTDAMISGTVYSYYGRRLWQVSVEGRNEEEFDIYYRSSAGGSTWFPLTINDFVNRVLQHKGWSASASTAAGSGIRAYANSTTGYAVWLGGMTWKAAGGGGSDEKLWIDVLQNQSSADTTVYAQTYFDEINGNMVPDYTDPFGVYTSNVYISIPSAAILRGHAHGNVFQSDGQPKNLSTIVYRLTSTSASRGSGTTTANGEYATGAPKGLPTQSHTVWYGSTSSVVNPTFTAKRNRRTFKDPVLTADQVAADVAGDQTVTLATIVAGNVILYYTGDPTPTNWILVSTSLTGVQYVDIRYSKTDYDQKLVIVTQNAANQINRYETLDQGGTISVATFIDDGTFPCVATNPLGYDYIAYRHTSGALKVKVRDAMGNVLRTVTAVASIPSGAMDIYWRLDTLYIVYKDAVGLQVITSTDDGDTWA
jgi:hypothetical protein